MPRNLLLLALSLLFSSHALASTVLKVEFDQLARNASLVIEAEVISKQVRASKINGRPCTYFLFEIMEVIKGTFDEAEIELCFAGGTLDGITMQVSDMTMPTIGETGVYFVDAPDKEPVHPLLGWRQGHYLVKKDSAQVERVMPAFPESFTSEGLPARVQSLERSPDLQTFKQLIKDQL